MGALIVPVQAVCVIHNLDNSSLFDDQLNYLSQFSIHKRAKNPTEILVRCAEKNSYFGGCGKKLSGFFSIESCCSMIAYIIYFDYLGVVHIRMHRRHRTTVPYIRLFFFQFDFGNSKNSNIGRCRAKFMQ